MRRNKGRRFAAVILGILMVVTSGVGVYAFEGGSYHDLRDGDISFYLPDGWSSEEIDAGESSEQPYEKIARLSGGALKLDLYYILEGVQEDDYIYFDDDEPAAMEYYNDYGMNAIDTLYGSLHEAEGSLASQWEQPAPTFYNGEWNGFLVLNITGSVEGETGGAQGFHHTVYLTAEMTDDYESVVHNILVFYKDDKTALTAEEAALAQEISNEFYDYDYGNVMAGATDGGDWNWDGADPPDGGSEAVTIILGILVTVIPMIITVLVIVFAVKKVLRRKKEKIRSAVSNAYQQIPKEIKEAQQKFNLDDTVNNWKKRRAEKDSFSGKEQKAERRSTMQMRNREAESAEQRYYASLQTLHKTGLLTKAEMRDMMERHERSRAWHKGHRH